MNFVFAAIVNPVVNTGFFWRKTLNIKYDKPFLTYEEQLNKFKTDYKIVSCNDKTLELNILKTMSYYELANGYKELYRNNECYNLTIPQIAEFIVFDKNFQNILSLYSIYIENTFKTKLAYIISKNKGLDVGDYLDIRKYKVNSKRYKKFKSTIKNIQKVENSNDNPTKFYKSNHNHVPAWILFKNVKFNDVIDLYSFLTKDEKLELINEYYSFRNNIDEDCKLETFKNMITIVRKFRNKIVHNQKIINIRLEKTNLKYADLKLIDRFGLISCRDVIKSRGTNDIYSMVISLLNLLNENTLIESFCKSLINILTFDSKQVEKYFSIYNYPYTLLDRLNNIIKNIRV